MSTAANAIEGYLDGPKVSVVIGDQLLGPAAAMGMCSLMGAVLS